MENHHREILLRRGVHAVVYRNFIILHIQYHKKILFSGFFEGFLILLTRWRLLRCWYEETLSVLCVSARSLIYMAWTQSDHKQPFRLGSGAIRLRGAAQPEHLFFPSFGSRKFWCVEAGSDMTCTPTSGLKNERDDFVDVLVCACAFCYG